MSWCENAQWYRCPECNSDNVECYTSGNNITNKHGLVEFKSDGVYTGFMCEDCGWNGL